MCELFRFFVFFFFSSRRRHTRLVSDWSSDVCSSDLIAKFQTRSFHADKLRIHIMRTVLKFSRSEEHTSELQSLTNLVCRLLLEKKKRRRRRHENGTTAPTDTQTPHTSRLCRPPPQTF